MNQPLVAGQLATCRGAYGYNLTVNKKYTILTYEPPEYAGNCSGFTWPAYVSVKDDEGDVVLCHAYRFVGE